MKTVVPLCVVVLLYCTRLSAQEEEQAITYGKKYIELNVKSLDKYSRRVQMQQKILLHKLKRKETQLVKQLKRKDSAAYARYQSQPLNYDSISRMLQPDSLTLISKTRNKTNKIVDSLRGVQSFLQTSAAKAGVNNSGLSNYTEELSGLQQKLDYNEYINGLIIQHTNNLKGLGTKANIPALDGIEKSLWAGKSKIAAWKQVADEPSTLENRALEYLQGTAGFDQTLNKATTSPTSMQAGMDGDALSAAGFQTKASVNKALQEKLGNNISQVQQQLGAQINGWQDKAQGLASEAKQAKAQVKQTAQQIKCIQKPSFRINPMRGLPFCQRIEKGYNFQTTRATNDGKPAILQLAATAGFKWSPKLTTSTGIAASFGLGKDWSHIKLTFEGVGFRTSAQWRWMYGIGLFAGYERTYKRFAFIGAMPSVEISTPYSVHNTTTWNESILLGLTKSYRLNSKWKGEIQLLYDLWWREKDLRTPILLRIASIKNSQ